MLDSSARPISALWGRGEADPGFPQLQYSCCELVDLSTFNCERSHWGLKRYRRPYIVQKRTGCIRVSRLTFQRVLPDSEFRTRAGSTEGNCRSHELVPKY